MINQRSALGRVRQEVLGHQVLTRKISFDVLIVMSRWTNLGRTFGGLKGGSVHLLYLSEAGLEMTSTPDVLKLCAGAGSQFVSLSSCRSIISNRTTRICLEGSRSFIQTAYALLNLGADHNVLVLTHPFRHRGRSTLCCPGQAFRWLRVSHAQIGGLSTGRWVIGYPSKWGVLSLSELSLSFGLSRSVRDAILCNIDGIEVPPCSTSPYHLESVPYASITSPWITPSVFSKTGWVQRRLVLKEIGALYDISELVCVSVETVLGKGKYGFDPFAGCVPGKVASVLTSLVVRSLDSNQDIEPTSTVMQFKRDNSHPETSVENPGSLLKNPGSSSEHPGSCLTNPGSCLKNPGSLDAPISAVNISSTNTDLITPANTPLGLHHPSGHEVSDSSNDYIQQYGQKAAKSDDAPVPVHLWNSFLFRHHLPHLDFDTEVHGPALTVLREKFALRIYIRNTVRSFFTYLDATYGHQWWSQLHTTSIKSSVLVAKGHRRGGTIFPLDPKKAIELKKDLMVGLEGLRRVVQGSWWDWDFGSTLFFWRWPREIRKSARDGVPIFIEGTLPSYRKKQIITRDKLKFDSLKKKIQKVIDRKYLAQIYVKSVINYFDVPKGENDIRIVYDGTKSKLNDAVWAPNFFLPSIDSVLMWVSADSWHADRDLGEMFLNYFMDERLRPFSGVDVTKLFESEVMDWRAWSRMFMGFKPSPYVSGKLYGWTIDIIHGNQWDPRNPFRWNKVHLNLPGQTDYTPTLPRLYKVRDDNKMANELEAYVDDIRPTGSSELECQSASSRVAQITQYLGQQDAPRKCRPPSKVPGPWCGAFVASYEGSVWVYVSQEKWDKAKRIVRETCQELENFHKGLLTGLNHKTLEKGRGFLVYFTRTYTSLTPYLKGIHLTLDSWREGRDAEGWKLGGRQSKKASIDCRSDHESDTEFDDGGEPLGSDENVGNTISKSPSGYIPPPTKVIPVPRLHDDLIALKAFLDAEKPPWRLVRGNQVAAVQYGFGDASKSGFGATFELPDESVWFRFGVWGSDEQTESSNFRELNNLVEALEIRLSSNKLNGWEIFLLTDNSTAEAAFHKGSSSSRKLFDLVLRLKQLALHHGVILHFIHVAGTRMIQQGTDGLSRGDLDEGVMKHGGILEYVPLHLNALERQKLISEWLPLFVFPSVHQKKVEFLTEADWFVRGHDIIGGSKNADGVWIPDYKDGTFIWLPPPAAGLLAVEQLRRARLKRENSTHVFIIPRLMSSEWKRQLFRVADLFLELPFDNIWKQTEQHEPLIIAFVFPFLSHSPWQLKRSRAFLGMAGLLRSMWKTDKLPLWAVLSKFFTFARSLETLPESVVRKLLSQSPTPQLLHSSGR